MALYLVGSNHFDLKGPERLSKFLGFVRPSYICLETSKESIEKTLSERILIKEELEKAKKFDEMMDRLHASTGMQRDTPSETNHVLNFLATLGYETWVSYEHKEKDNPFAVIVPLHEHATLVRDSPPLYREALGSENVDEQGSFTPKFLEDLATTSELSQKEFQETLNQDYLTANTFFATNPETKHLIPSIRQRDDEMEPKLREVAKKNDGTTVFICGNHHFFADYGNNLYERLQDLSPVRIKLPDVDKF